MEVLREQASVGHVIGVRQEDVGDAAERFEAAHQPGLELGRIDEPVAVRVLDEVAIAAVGMRRVEAAIMDRRFQDDGKVVHHRLGSIGALAADRAGRAADEGPQRLGTLLGVGRLPVHEGVVRPLGEHRRRHLAAGVAVDAGGIDEKIAGDILGDPFANVGHDALPVSFYQGGPVSPRLRV